MSSTRPWGSLPQKLRALLVCTQQQSASWLREALAVDQATNVALHAVASAAEAMAILREESFDAVFVRHVSEELDSLELCDALRGSGCDLPLIILGVEAEAEMSPLVFDAGADAYLSIQATTVRALLWSVSRAIERHALIRENGRLQQAHEQRLRHEQLEAQQQLAQRRALIGALSPTTTEASTGDAPSDEAWTRLSTVLGDHYRELLRAQVIMGAGQLGGDMADFVERATQAAATPALLARLHVDALEELVRGLGSRSARHAMNRADLLLLELLMRFAEGVRSRQERDGRDSGRHPTSTVEMGLGRSMTTHPITTSEAA